MAESQGGFDEEENMHFRFIKNSLETCLQSLSQEKVIEIAQALATDGLTEQRAHLVTVEDLQDMGLNKYEMKALVAFWSKPPIETHDENAATPATNATATVNRPSLVDIIQFKLNWEAIYNLSFQKESARQVLSKGQRPSPKLRILIIAEIVRQVMLKVSSVTRATFNPIYYNDVMIKHPNSFRELLGHGTECSGGFLHQLKTKFDNDKRPNRNAHLRNEDLTNKLYECPKGKFSYGCVRWRVKDLPEGMNETSVREQKLKMQQMYEEVRPKFWDWESINTMMENSYKAQRDLINKNMEDAMEEQRKARQQKRKQKQREEEDLTEEALDDAPQAPTTICHIAKEYPFLFTYQGMLLHFQKLTQVDIEAELVKFKETDMEALIKFFKSKDDDEFYRKTIKAMEKAETKNRIADIQLRAISLMVPHYFKEEPFIQLVEETSTIESLEAQKKTPQYPGLTAPAKGESIFKAKKFFLGVDSEFHYSLVSFERAMCCVYMLFFVFNLDYPPSTQTTMEFLQRYIFHVDPTSGNKRPLKTSAPGKYSTKVVHPEVAKLVRKVQKFQTAGDSSSDSNASSAEEVDAFE